jgi:hypothetical protein
MKEWILIFIKNSGQDLQDYLDFFMRLSGMLK